MTNITAQLVNDEAWDTALEQSRAGNEYLANEALASKAESQYVWATLVASRLADGPYKGCNRTKADSCYRSAFWLTVGAIYLVAGISACVLIWG